MKMRLWSMVILAACLLGTGTSHAQPAAGKQAPLFELRDLSGKSVKLASLKSSPLTILYFFDVESRPSQEGLLSLNELARQHGPDLTVLAISVSSRERLERFASQSALNFPVLADSGEVSSLYGARQVLPVVCILGPGLKTLDYFQGGGKSTEAMLERVAERELQRKKPKAAVAVSGLVAKKNPQSVKAKAVRGYAALREGDLKRAQQIFEELAGREGEAQLVGKEGLAAVYTRRGEFDKALPLIREVERKAPERSYAHVLEGNILAARNRKQDAEAAYRSAVAGKGAAPYHDAVRYNQLGRLYASEGKQKQARELYQQAETIDPYYVEGTTNKGITYEKEGNWTRALDSYRQALAVDGGDTYARLLAARAQEMLDLQRDTERSRRIDLLVKELAERFKSQQKEKLPEDVWTSRPMVMTFVDFQEKGGLSERDGFATVLMTDLTNSLNASGRVKVVERALMERLLEELRLGSSQLADPETALRLGKVLAAKLIGTGSVFYLPQQSVLSLRLIDTETSEIPEQLTRQLGLENGVESELMALNREILKTVITRYPLRGYLMKVNGEQGMINIGARQGVVGGTVFDVVEEGGTITYKGRTLRSSAKVVGSVEVVRVEPDLAWVKLGQAQRPLKVDDKIQERVYETGK